MARTCRRCSVPGRVRNGRKIHLDVAADHRGGRVRHSLIGNMDHVDLGALPENFGGQIRGAGDAGRREIELARRGSSQRQTLSASLLIISRYDRDKRHRCDDRHPGEILHRIELETLVDDASDGVAVGCQHQGVAVGGALRHRSRPRQTRILFSTTTDCSGMEPSLSARTRARSPDATGAEWDNNGHGLGRDRFAPRPRTTSATAHQSRLTQTDPTTNHNFRICFIDFPSVYLEAIAVMCRPTGIQAPS